VSGFIKEFIMKIYEDKVPCTDCGCCEGKCPSGLDIPKFLALFNEYVETGDESAVISAINDVPEDNRPNKCIGCGTCQLACPEPITIWKVMGKLANIAKN